VLSVESETSRPDRCFRQASERTVAGASWSSRERSRRSHCLREQQLPRRPTTPPLRTMSERVGRGSARFRNARRAASAKCQLAQCRTTVRASIRRHTRAPASPGRPIPAPEPGAGMVRPSSKWSVSWGSNRNPRGLETVWVLPGAGRALSKSGLAGSSSGSPKTTSDVA
jgi:hypothetical protein